MESTQVKYLHKKDQLRTLTRGAYDIQKLRIQMGNRIIGNFKAKILGQAPSQSEETLDEESRDILKELRTSYRKLMDGVKTFPRMNSFKGDEVISDYTELSLVHQYMQLEETEKSHFTKLSNILHTYPVYQYFLEEVRGVGPAMAAVIISELDVYKAKYPSSFIMYAGLDVAPDGKGRSRRKEHLVEQEYTNKEGGIATKLGITFNPFLKTKLVGVLGSSFLRSGRDHKYSSIYYNYKNRLENHPKHKDKSVGHRHNMAIRYMIKHFLIDLHVKWRELEGLEVSKPYHEAKLGLVHEEGEDRSSKET